MEEGYPAGLGAFPRGVSSGRASSPSCLGSAFQRNPSPTTHSLEWGKAVPRQVWLRGLTGTCKAGGSGPSVATVRSVQLLGP